LLFLRCSPGRLSCPTATFRDIIRHDGFRGLYRGLGPTILGYLPTWAIYFAVYDGIKTRFGELPLGIDASIAKSERLYPAPSAKGYQPNVREHPWSLHLLSAMVAGATSTVCTLPFWVIKTRIMVRHHTPFTVLPLASLSFGFVLPSLTSEWMIHFWFWGCSRWVRGISY
jgi:Mitochondrial carrier protein